MRMFLKNWTALTILLMIVNAVLLVLPSYFALWWWLANQPLAGWAEEAIGLAPQTVLLNLAVSLVNSIAYALVAVTVVSIFTARRPRPR